MNYLFYYIFNKAKTIFCIIPHLRKKANQKTEFFPQNEAAAEPVRGGERLMLFSVLLLAGQFVHQRVTDSGCHIAAALAANSHDVRHPAGHNDFL